MASVKPQEASRVVKAKAPKPPKHQFKRKFLRIHGEWYDTTDFQHPGGPIALGLGLNRDATVLFEAHHPFTSRDRLRALLKKFRVPEAEAKRLGLRTLDPRDEDKNSVFDWGTGGFERQRSPFEKEVIDEVYAHFKQKADEKGVPVNTYTKATPGRWFQIILFITLALVSAYYLYLGHWWALFAAPFWAWIAAANTTHDAMHFSVSNNWKINGLLGFTAPFTSSPLMWYHQHVIGHHAYPNVGFRDPDLAHAPALMRVHESVKWKPPHRLQLIWTVLIWTLGATLYMTIVPIKTLLMGTFNKAVYLQYLSTPRIIRHLLGRVIVVSLLWSWPWFVFPLWKAIIFALIPMYIHSFLFMMSTQLNHLTKVNTEASDPDYWKHQVVTSHSFATESYWVFLLTGGLNMQIEHHLFPAVNHCHLPEIHEIVTRVCKKHNVYYHYSDGMISALSKYVTHVHEMSKKPLSEALHED